MTLDLCELLRMRIVLADLKITIDEPIGLFCDNQSAISIVHYPVQHDKTKHIDIDQHFIKEKLEKGIIQMPYVLFEKQVSDLLTKGLATRRFEDLVCKLGLMDIHSPI